MIFLCFSKNEDNYLKYIHIYLEVLGIISIFLILATVPDLVIKVFLYFFLLNHLISAVNILEPDFDSNGKIALSTSL